MSVSTSATPCVKCILQQCKSATLDISETESVRIGCGTIIYVTFLKGATQDLVKKVASTLVSISIVPQHSLERPISNKPTSILHSNSSVLIIPQASLGAKLKGKSLQYHSNVDKSIGEDLYALFTTEISRIVTDHHDDKGMRCTQNNSEDAKGEKEVKVRWGTYGFQQRLRMESNGPFSCLLEF
ncbi:putative D-tyrosyl-tRNA deacylase 2 [Paraphysoderma sedebokerense]|nr:putative D-tyrosyl-tRNA deacylase 2 [Paraphysoderma sedebokerense]